MGSCAEDQVLTPLQHSALKGTLQEAHSKHGQLCQRIRVLTPLQHSLHRKRNAAKRKQTWAAVPEGSGVDSSATQCTAKERCNRRATTMALCQSSGTDSLCNTVHKDAARSSNKHGQLSEDQVLTPLQHSAQNCMKRKQTWAAVSEDQEC
jgi:hypothetical protein